MDYNSDNDEVNGNSGFLMEADDDAGLSEDITSHVPWQNYTILTKEDIRERMKDDITTLCMVLSISGFEASILLRHYNWSISKVNDAWFADEHRVRKEVGLLEKPVLVDKTKTLTCGICFDSYPSERFNSAACGHPYCSEYWFGYITTSINNDGLRSLTLRCPDPKCRVAVGHDIIDLLASEENKKQYANCLIKSYVEDNKKTKWCPAPGCEYAVDYVGGGESFNVTCNCSHSFCFNCTEETHRPVDCETVKKWILKNSSESENMNYILAFTKPCPKCRVPIEKDMGCMNMRCRCCSTYFCWLCLRLPSQHDARTCNRCQEGNDEDERRKEKAKQYIQRYTHYFERWAANHKSLQKALADLEKIKNEQLKKHSDIQGQPEALLENIIKAWLQIADCRRVIKWTYAFGYYLPHSENAKRNFFEYLHGETEAALEKLHQCAEQELQGLINDGGTSKNFIDFSTKFVGLTQVGH